MHPLVRATPVMGWLLYAAIAQATPVVDQQFTPSGNFAALAVANDRTQIQTFTVGITGTLTSIDVLVSKQPQTVEDLVLSLWSTNAAGLPQTRLTADSLAPTDPAFAPPFLDALVPFDLTAAAVPVAAGELLAIELNSNATNNPPFFDQRYLWKIGGQYDRGAAYTQIGTTIFPQTDDLHFVDFVNPAAEPGTLPLLSTALAGLLAYGWRRRRGDVRFKLPEEALKKFAIFTAVYNDEWTSGLQQGRCGCRSLRDAANLENEDEGARDFDRHREDGD